VTPGRSSHSQILTSSDSHVRPSDSHVRPSIRLVVFDLDGTLVDSRRDIAESANATLVSFGAPPLSEEAIGRMVGDGAPVLVARAFAAQRAVKPRDALDRFLTIYNSRLLIHTRPYEGMTQVLADLAPRMDLAVLTNKPLAATRAILDGLDLTRYFPDDRVVGGDGPFPRKPDPTGLQHLMALCGASGRETVLVGDSVVDWRTTRAAATGSCLARYGFGWETFPMAEIESEGAWLIDAPQELLRYL
jgi:phosphoglycolate phosphatase